MKLPALPLPDGILLRKNQRPSLFSPSPPHRSLLYGAMAGAGQLSLPLPHPQLVGADARCFGPVIRMRDFAEPGMLQSLFRGDAVRGVVDEDLLEEVQELLQKFGI